MKKIFVMISVAVMLLMGMDAMAQNPTSQIGPVDNYGFMTTTSGAQWTYTASFEKKWGTYTMVTLSVYDENHALVGKIVDSLKIDNEHVTGVNQAEINPLVTQKFFNKDDKHEIVLFLHAQTDESTNYEGLYFNHVFSIGGGETVTAPIATVNGRQVYALNKADFGENYILVFARDSAKYSNDYTVCFDIYRKSEFGDDGAYRTFRVPGANIQAGETELQSFFAFKNRKNQVDYVMQQYEKPYFDPTTPLDQDPVVTPDNNLVITYMDQFFKVLHTTKIPVVQDEDPKLLYTFPMLGSLNGMNDILLNYAGENPAYIITQAKYALESDGMVNSYYIYDVNGKKVKTIAENTLGRIKMSPVVGEEDQWLFMKEEYDGEFMFVNIPSCEVTADISVYLNDKDVLSSAIDRYPCGDSYEYAVALLQGENEEDGTVSQRIAWLAPNGSLKRFEKINMGKYIEAAQLNITADVLNPRLFNTDDAREYMVLVKRYNPDKTTDKETALLICNTKGEILLDYGKSAELGGDINMVYVTEKDGAKSLVCVYANGDALTLNYTSLPLNKVESLKGKGTKDSPYQLASALDFLQIKNAPGAYYEVVNNIDFSGVPFEGVRGAFTGKLDGNNHVLKDLLLQEGGLFGEVKDSVVIKNIVFVSPTLALTGNTKNNAGILADAMQGGTSEEGVNISAELSNVHVVNPVVKCLGYKEYVGTLLGDAALFLDINSCSVKGAVIDAPEANVGGLVGKAATSTNIHACVFTGSVNGGEKVGGIVAEISSGEPVYDCRVDADLQGKNTIGGVVGSSARSKVYNCYSQGSLTLDSKSTIGKVGGIVGEIETDWVGTDSTIVLSNCLVGVSKITVPTGKDVVAHRVAGFTSGDSYEYDYDKSDLSKPKDEWIRIYGNPEKYMKNNYVVSALAAVDATVALTDNTPEGATLAWSDVNSTWLNAHGFATGKEVVKPWSLAGGVLKLWYEASQDILMEFDATTGKVDRIYGAEDSLLVEKKDDGVYVEMIAANGSDICALYFYPEKYDEEITIGAGVYTINNTKGKNTVYACPGMDGNVLSPSYYAKLAKDGKSLEKPMYFLVKGTVEVAKEDGLLYIEVKGENNFGMPIHVVYQVLPTGIADVEVDGVNSAEKLMIDGQLVIKRHGAMFNVLGARVK